MRVGSSAGAVPRPRRVLGGAALLAEAAPPTTAFGRCDQLRPVDLAARGSNALERLPDELTADVLARLAVILGRGRRSARLGGPRFPGRFRRGRPGSRARRAATVRLTVRAAARLCRSPCPRRRSLVRYRCSLTGSDRRHRITPPPRIRGPLATIGRTTKLTLTASQPHEFKTSYRKGQKSQRWLGQADRQQIMSRQASANTMHAKRSRDSRNRRRPPLLLRSLSKQGRNRRQ